MSMASKHAAKIKAHEEYLQTKILKAKFNISVHVTDNGGMWVNGMTISSEDALKLRDWITEVFE